MKKLLTIGSAALLVAALALPAAAAQFAHIPAGPIKMEMTEKPVYFDHNVHTSDDCTVCHTKMPAHFPPLTVDYEKQCAVCHHKVAGTTPKFKCGTAGCHDPEDMHAENAYFKIIHDRKIFGRGHVADSCLGCHFDVIKTRPEKKLSLTGCAGSACHPKTEK